MIGRLRAGEGETMRENMRKVKVICQKSWESGKSREVMVGMSRYF